MEKFSIERVRDDACERGLPRSWGSPEEDRGESSCFDEFPDRLSWSDQVRLSDEIIEILWSEERSKGRDVAGKERLHARKYIDFRKKEKSLRERDLCDLWCYDIE